MVTGTSEQEKGVALTVLHTLDLDNVVVKILHKVLYLRPGVRINVIEHIVQNWTKTFARMTHTSEIDKEMSKLKHTSEPLKEGDSIKKVTHTVLHTVELENTVNKVTHIL
jgi:hypothetical protein